MFFWNSLVFFIEKAREFVPLPRHGNFKLMLIREGIRICRQGRNNQNNSAALGQDPGFISRDRQNNIFELFYRSKIPSKQKMLPTWWAFFIPERRPQLVTLRPTEAHQETIWCQIKEMKALHTPWSLSAALTLNYWYKTPHQIPQFGTQFFEGRSSLCPPLPDKGI